MATAAYHAAAFGTTKAVGVYTLCCFEPAALVPSVQLIEARSEHEAIQIAQSMTLFKRREVWDRHRLIITIPAES